MQYIKRLTLLIHVLKNLTCKIQTFKCQQCLGTGFLLGSKYISFIVCYFPLEIPAVYDMLTSNSQVTKFSTVDK